jgi:hypothetical protein
MMQEKPMAGNEDVPVDKALKRVEQISSLGLALASLEFLTQPQVFTDTGLLSWQVERSRHKWTAGKAGDLLDYLFKPPGIYVIYQLRLAAALALINPYSSKRVRDTAVAYIAATNYLLHFRIRYGTDGTEHMSLLTYATLTASRIFANDEKAKEACAWFLAGQTNLSYFAAGLSKLVGAPWRNGMAMPGIFRTTVYGDKRVHDLLKSRPRLAKAAGWAVVASELAMPLMMTAPKLPAWALLGMGGSFHVGNAVFMGLNRFVYSFVGTYPAIVHVAKNMSAADVARLADFFRKPRRG